MPNVVLVSAVRTPVGRAPKGALSTTRPDDLAALALSGALDRVSALDKREIDDVILGCAQPEGEQGWDVARWAILRAGWPVEIPAPRSIDFARRASRLLRLQISASVPAPAASSLRVA